MRHTTHAQRRRSIPWMVAVTLISTPVGANPALNPAVTQANIDQTVCVHGYTKTVRPSFFTTQRIKGEMVKALHMDGRVILDHVVPLCAGGAPLSLSNLQLQTWEESTRKDRVEFVACACICSHQVTLAEVQADFSGDWRVAYKKYAGMVCRRAR